MNDAEKKALLGISLLAAFADGEKSEMEHSRIQRLGESLELGPLDVPELHEHAASGVLSLAALAESLTTRETRLQACEMALGVCESDDQLKEPERAFLRELQSLLALDDASIQAARTTTQQLRAAFDSMMGEARSLQAKYAPQIEACSRNLRLQNLLPGGSG